MTDEQSIPPRPQHQQQQQQLQPERVEIQGSRVAANNGKGGTESNQVGKVSM
jgi:hypothetical protein